MSNRYPGDEPGRTYQYPSWPEDGDEREREPDPSAWAADPAGSVGEPGPPAYRPVDPDEPSPPYPPDQSYRPDRPQPTFRPAPGPRDPAYPDGGFYEAPGNGYRDFPDDPPRRPVTNYRSPTTWSGPPAPPPAEPPRGRPEPDAPVEGHREPGGWYQATPERPAPPRRPAEPPRSPEPARAAGPVRAAQPTRGDEPANQAPDERAWWDDAFQPSSGGPPAAGGRALPSGARGTATPAAPPAPPAPPRRPRPASAQGYGVPPGDLTQPISIYQPQPRFVPQPLPGRGHLPRRGGRGDLPRPAASGPARAAGQDQPGPDHRVDGAGHPDLPDHRVPAHVRVRARARHPQPGQRLQQRQHDPERGLRRHDRRCPDQRGGAAAGQGGPGPPRPRRGLRPADVHAHRAGPRQRDDRGHGRGRPAGGPVCRIDPRHRAPAHGGVRLLLHPADLLLRAQLADGRDP